MKITLIRLPKVQALIDELSTYTTVIKQFFTFAIGTFLTRGLSILFAPITMQILTPSDYGLLALANSFITILTVFLGLGLRQALPLEYFHKDHIGRIQLLNDITCIYGVLAIPLLIIMFCNIGLLNKLIFVDQAPQMLIIISLLITFIYFFVELFYQVLQYQTKAWQLTKIQAGMTILIIGLNLFFLCIVRLGVCSIFLGQLLGMSMVLMVGLKSWFKKNCFIQVDMKRSLNTMRTHITLGLPFMPSVLFGWILSSGNRWVLAHMTSMHHVGIYSVADTLGQLANMIVFYAITGSYMPYLLNKFRAHTQSIIALEQANKRAMWFCMLSSFVLLTLGFVSCKWILYRLMPPIFHEAITYMWFLLVGSIFLLGTYFLNCLIQFKKRSIFLGFVLAIPAVLNIGLNVLLIPYLGLYGCVLATLLSYACYFCITFWYNQRLCFAERLVAVEQQNAHQSFDIDDQGHQI